MTDPNDDKDALDAIESLLMRMLIGAVKFPFTRLPKILGDALRYLSPTALKIGKICVISAGLILIVFGPYYLANWMNAPSLVLFACQAWSAVAIFGAIWGTMYVRWKRKRARAEALTGTGG